MRWSLNAWGQVGRGGKQQEGRGGGEASSSAQGRRCREVSEEQKSGVHRCGFTEPECFTLFEAWVLSLLRDFEMPMQGCAVPVAVKRAAAALLLRSRQGCDRHRAVAKPRLNRAVAKIGLW
jgi:hypothetical protein